MGRFFFRIKKHRAANTAALLCALLLSASVFLSGCVKAIGEIPQQQPAGDQVSAQEEEPEKTPVPADLDVTDEEALEAYRGLMEKAVSALEEDRIQDFNPLYHECDEYTRDVAKSILAFRTWLENDYENMDYAVVTSYEGFFYCNTLSWEVTDGEVEYQTINHVISRKEGVWGFDPTPEAQNAIMMAGQMIVPPGFLEASTAGRNNINSRAYTDYTWVTLQSFPGAGCVVTKCYFFWQQADGSVTCFVNIKNGQDEDLALEAVKVSVKDTALGPVCEEYAVTWSDPYIVSAGSARNLEITIPASLINTGTSIWSAVHTYVELVPAQNAD